jgi:hypothetical protein
MARCNPFLLEYQSLSEKIAELLKGLRKSDLEWGTLYHESPKPSGLPLPVLSLLDGIVILEPGVLMGISRAMREKHFRKELREKTGEPMERVLKELAPRLNHWYQSAVNALKESYHIQTDLIRYRSQGTNSENSQEHPHYTGLAQFFVCWAIRIP